MLGLILLGLQVLPCNAKLGVAGTGTISFTLAKSWTFPDRDVTSSTGGQPVLLISDRRDRSISGANRSPRLTTRHINATVRRALNETEYTAARLKHLIHQQSTPLEWALMNVPSPNVQDRETLLSLARSSWNAYFPTPDDSEWYSDTIRNWTAPFGWDPTEDGLKGHLFLSEGNRTGLITFKGTSISELFTRPPSKAEKRDKINDNLLFSCCCASVRWPIETDHHPCRCDSGGGKCGSTCLTTSLLQSDSYWTSAEMVVARFLETYPNTTFWFTGHSLGGAIAALMGLRFGLPAVTFESPGERLAASRLHILPPSTLIPPITHVYNNVDPIALGTCNGRDSICAHSGYAMESRCRVGRNIVFDLAQTGIKFPLIKHRLQTVFELLEDEGQEIPSAVHQGECQDCSQWKFGDYPERDPPDPFWSQIWNILLLGLANLFDLIYHWVLEPILHPQIIYVFSQTLLRSTGTAEPTTNTCDIKID